MTDDPAMERARTRARELREFYVHLFSLPELGFQNIRKGSSDWVAPGLRPVDP